MNEREISAVPREARPYQGASAGLVTRLIANTIDAVVVGVALGATYLGFAAFVFMLDPREFTFPKAGVLLSITAALGLSTAYLALAWWIAGRTYGDHVMGLRVVGRGRRLGPMRSLARAAFCVFFPIGLFWCVVSPERRSVQDVVLWTRVVYDWLPGDHPLEAHHRADDGQEAPHRADDGHETHHRADERHEAHHRAGHGHAAHPSADRGAGPPPAGEATADPRPRDSGDASHPDPSDT